jgi:hypothetical protein
VSKLSKKARNAVVAKAAFSLARDHLLPETAKPKRRRGRKLLFGGVLAAVGAGLLLKRDKVLALLPGSHGGDEYTPPAPTPPPAPSNYDVSGPVANTATPVPAPDPVVPEPIDEAAEEAAAAAEAANIGGPTPDYASAAEPAQLAPEEERPLEEAGEGVSEGAEQAEADLTEAAGEATDAGEPERPAGEQGGSEWRTWSGRSVNP